MKKKVFLTGRDFVNWATDDDYFFIRKALEPIVDYTDNPEESDIIHSITWSSLTDIDRDILKNKYVFSHVPHDIRNMLSTPSYLITAPFIDKWLVPSSRAKHYTDLLGLPSMIVPYGINTEIFHPLENQIALREQYGIPREAFVIGSFQRDTEGIDLTTPKYIKGPDIFLEIIRNVYADCKNIHVVLAGPRRFWLIKELEKAHIPYTFIGKKIEGKDDLADNTLSHTTMNLLYNLSDLYIISSRMEGGPKAVLECIATKTRLISTPVGMAEDILEPSQVYNTFSEAVDIVKEELKTGNLQKACESNFKKLSSHQLPAISALLEKIYSGDLTKKESEKNIVFKPILYKPGPNTLLKKIARKLGIKKRKKLNIFFKIKKAPWGGGNQFLAALAVGLRKRGINAVTGHNLRGRRILFNSFHIDYNKLQKYSFNDKLVLHRIDGPTFLIRDKDKELDDKIFEINKKIVHASIFQSYWSLFATLEQGYLPVNPVVITNASDPAIFNRTGKNPFNTDRKIRLISTSWSKHPRKGGPIYKWLDENLDFDRFEYTFIGNISQDLKNIKVLPPVDSKKLAEYLKQHDIYITASNNDPCSNALIEALSCGLPAIYLNNGGHPELTGFGGLSFEEKEQIPGLLEKIILNYHSFQNLACPSSLDKVARLYRECLDISTI